jgi:hypothetical protein
MITPAEYHLVQKIIDGGYRALALKTHPDVGGRGAEMGALTIARDHLKRMAKAEVGREAKTPTGDHGRTERTMRADETV